MLRLVVILQCLFRAPGQLCLALLWRLFGLKVRARNILARVAARTPSAYRLWIATKENRARQENALGCERPLHTDMAIVIVVGSNEEFLQLQQTVHHSLSLKGVRRVCILAEEHITRSDFNFISPDILITNIFDELCVTKLVESRCRFAVFIKSGDRLSSSVHYEYTEAFRSGTEICYSDDDQIDDGVRKDPYFKPDWNSLLFSFQDYISYSSAILLQQPWPHTRISASEIGGLVARLVTSASNKPIHIPSILHHRTVRDTKRTNDLCQIPLPSNGTINECKVSIIVATKDKPDLLEKCISSIQLLSWKNREIIVVDHDSIEKPTIDLLRLIEHDGVKIIKYSGEFNFSALNNRAAEIANGDYLCFLNNDVECDDPDWLSRLMVHAIDERVGAVGPMLVYPNGMIQHAGIVLGVGGAAGHAHRFHDPAKTGYFDRARLPQHISAVTGACMVVRKANFEKVGGFDETRFQVAFNDVDLCLKLQAMGLANVYEPRSVLIHHESISRGSDRERRNRKRFEKELMQLKMVWSTDKIVDPFHNPNLSRLIEQFLIDVF